ncbi:unnamed protein product [Penicillium glandicola]
MDRSATNESAARCAVNNILIGVLDEVMEPEAYDTCPLNLQTETNLESCLITIQGVKQKLRGNCDYSLCGLATTAEPNQGRSSDTKKAHRVAHWGQAKRMTGAARETHLAASNINEASYVYDPASYLAAPDVSTQGFHHSWYHPADLSYDEVQMLNAHMEQALMYSFWCRGSHGSPEQYVVY